jgi:putative oxidoreductase
MIQRFLAPPDLSARASAGILVLRLVAGYAFIHHGWMKIQHPFSWMGPDSGWPGILLALAALSEFGGGIAWMLGLLTPIASFGLACTMAVACWFHAVKMGDPFVRQGPGGAYVLPALYFCIALLFLLAGPGRFSLDRFLFRRNQPA